MKEDVRANTLEQHNIITSYILGHHSLSVANC